MKDKLIFKFNKKRMLAAAFGIVVAIAMDAYMPENMLKFVLCVSTIFALAGLVDVKIRGRAAILIMLPIAVAAALFCLTFTQLINGYSPLRLSMMKIALGAEVNLIFILIFNLLFLLFFRNQGSAAKAAITVGSIVILLLAVINIYTYEARGKALSPTDITAVATAAMIVGNYKFSVTVRMWQAILFLAAAVFMLSGIKIEGGSRKSANVACSLLLTLALALHLNSALPSIKIQHFGNDGCVINGLMLNLMGQLKQMVIIEPQGYGNEPIALLEEEYPAGSRSDAAEKPDIIVVMNESFADLDIWGEFNTNIPVMPFIDSLHENAIKGNALASVLGGTTPNSEYEFLTGNSLLMHVPSSVPFEQYIKSESYCIENYLAEFGYTSFFTHPNKGTSWSRDRVYPLFGFDKTTFYEDYDNPKHVKGYASDRSVYEHLIAEYEKRGNEPQFMFAVTIQNHSRYTTGYKFDDPLWLTEYEFPEADEYLSSIRESDNAFRGLIEYFETVEEPVVVMMFGDHHPYFTEQFGTMIGRENTSDAFGTNMSQYKVPFVIWTNYDIEEQQVELTSLNFLSNYLLEAAGIPLSPYNRFLKDVQQVIPAMNAYGYWSNSKGGFAAYDEAQGEEKKWLEAYEILQYNAMFDKKNRSEVFFPID